VEQFGVILEHVPGVTEENQDSQCPDLDSNRALPKYQCRALPLR
jgi:hypothetical protein